MVTGTPDGGERQVLNGDELECPVSLRFVDEDA